MLMPADRSFIATGTHLVGVTREALPWFPESAFLAEPVLGAVRHGPWYWAATIAATIVFLVAYFRGYWERGARLVGIVAVFTALAVCFSPVNGGAGVFFVYAAAFGGQLDRPRDAVRALAWVTIIGP